MIQVLTILVLASFGALCSAQLNGEALRFRLSAINLPNCDLDGPSDPFVKLFSTTAPRGGDNHRDWEKFGQTSVKYNTLNPVWDEVFVYRYANGTNQRWRFIVKDLDNTWLNPIDDHLGRVEMNVDDYMFQLKSAKQNGSQALKYISMFLSHPIGGALLVTPIFD
ncbi:Synaptotagmin-9 [Orchesella cincta]|uniref:Synaptotagmin-9 n=1 Tax=Orchesella cincta TaxID=48709 RepID=A0A1D2NHM4_ORCCI|nr:Synaptotagmin-9 [Orchesella cincta]